MQVLGSYDLNKKNISKNSVCLHICNLYVVISSVHHKPHTTHMHMLTLCPLFPSTHPPTPVCPPTHHHTTSTPHRYSPFAHHQFPLYLRYTIYLRTTYVAQSHVGVPSSTRGTGTDTQRRERKRERYIRPWLCVCHPTHARIYVLRRFFFKKKFK